MKYDLGLFSNPYYSNMSNPNIATVGSSEDIKVSVDTVRESLTLLQNVNSTLPLDAKVMHTQRISLRIIHTNKYLIYSAIRKF